MAQVRVTPVQLVRVLILLVAVVFAFVGMFTSWWTIEGTVTTEYQGQKITNSGSIEAKPYSAGRFEDDSFGSSGKGLDTEVLVTGLLFTFALVGAVGLLALEITSIALPSLPAVLRLGLVVGTALLGAAAVLYTAFAWPAGVDDEASFFDSKSYSDGTTSGKQTIRAGIGWYFAILSTFLLPVTAFGLSVLGAKQPAPAPGGGPEPVPPAQAPEPMSTSAPTSPPPATGPPPSPVPVRRAAVLRPKTKP